MRGKKLREGLGLTVLNIFFIALCFVTLIPILYALSVSFNGQNALLSSDFSFIPKDFTLDNYLRVFTGEDIMTWFGNSVILAAATVAISLAAAVPAAYCFSRRSFPGRRLVLRWLVLLNSFPAILSMFAVYRLLHLDRPITPLFQGQYDIRMVNAGMKMMLGKDKIEVSDLPKINPLKINQTLHQIVDGINSIPAVPEYYAERKENQ